MLTKDCRKFISKKTEPKKRSDSRFEAMYMEKGTKKRKYKLNEYVTVIRSK